MCVYICVCRACFGSSIEMVKHLIERCNANVLATTNTGTIDVLNAAMVLCDSDTYIQGCRACIWQCCPVWWIRPHI